MHISNINSSTTYCSKTVVKTAISKSTINRFGLNLNTRIGAEPRKFKEAPDNISSHDKKYFDLLQVDWRTHINKLNKESAL